MLAEAARMKEEGAAKLRAHWEEIEEMTVEALGAQVLHCRLDEMFNKDLRRITFHVRDRGVNDMMTEALRATGAEQKLGRAPRSNLERELQKFADAMK